MVGAAAGWFELRWERDRAVLVARPGYRPPASEPLPDDALPMSRMAAGLRDIRRAWLVAPTARYAHGVLGDRLEAGALRVERRDGRQFEFRLPVDAVFEDLVPRIASLGADGRDSILVVRSTAASGAALAAYRLADAGIEEQAITEPIGTPMRWLNPVGAADFDGDGRNDVAVVWHPHIGGLLNIYSLEGGRFVETARQPGFSNHDIGSTELALHAVGDFDGDGIADLAIRGADRRSLVVLGFAKRNLRRLATFSHPGPLVGPVIAVDLDGNGRADLVYVLGDGSLAVARR